MITLGVDLAGQSRRNKTAICKIRWDETPAVVASLRKGATDTDLLELFGCADKIGIDAPFGWPACFVQAINRYSTATNWPINVDVQQLRFRRTDMVVWKKAGCGKSARPKPPLSVSADKIAMLAMRLASLLTTYAAATGEAIYRCGAGRFVETYPAAALSRWGFRSQRYKGAEGSEFRAQLVRCLAVRTRSWLTLTEEDRSRCKESDDVLDALVSALVARAAAIGRCEPIPPENRDLAAVEGWIALPQRGSLERLN